MVFNYLQIDPDGRAISHYANNFQRGLTFLLLLLLVGIWFVRRAAAAALKGNLSLDTTCMSTCLSLSSCFVEYADLPHKNRVNLATGAPGGRLQ